MRAILGAAAVEVQVRFAGDLLHVTELSVGAYEVGLSTTAQLPLPLPPFRLLQVVDHRIELCVSEAMTAWVAGRLVEEGQQVAAAETVTLRWGDVEIAIAPTAPSAVRRLAPRRAWPLEILSSTAGTVLGLTAIFPAAILLVGLSLSQRESQRTLAAHIVFTYRSPPGSEDAPPPARAATSPSREAASQPSTVARDAAQVKAAAAEKAEQASHELAATAPRDGAAAAEEAAAAAAAKEAAANAKEATAAAKEATAAAAKEATAAAKEVAAAAAKEAAARSGILGLLDGQVQIAPFAGVGTGSGASGGPSGASGAASGASGAASGASGASGAASGASGAASGASGAASGAASGGSGDGIGGLEGVSVGEAYGVGGLGLVGNGVGGGGSGEGTIGLGNLGTIGHGSGTGSGYGSGAGGLGGRRAHAPDVVAGSAQVRGGLDKEAIRRVIRRHLNEVRFCYEKALQQQPTLAGRVLVEFLIQPDGSVAASLAQQSTVADPAVAACTASAFRRWQFPMVRGGGQVLVFYPFDFVPAGS